MRGRVDVHHHIFPPEYVSSMPPEILRVPKDPWSVEQALEVMGQNNIEFAATSVSTEVTLPNRGATAKVARQSNDYGAKLRHDKPESFGLLATLPLPYMDEALKEVGYAFDELGADGVALMTNYQGKYLGDPELEPLLQELDRRNAVAFVHPTTCECPTCHPKVNISLLEFPFDTTRTITSLFFSGALYKYPNIKFIFSHGGGTVSHLAYRIAMVTKTNPAMAYPGAPDIWTALKGLYYDVVTAVAPSMMRSLLEVAPLDHVLFGTDYPFIPAWRVALMIEQFGESGLSAEDIEKIGFDNARPLFPRLQR